MKIDQTRKEDNVARAEEPADRRRPYQSPTLKRYEKLPAITAGSISRSQWQLPEGNG